MMVYLEKHKNQKEKICRDQLLDTGFLIYPVPFLFHRVSQTVPGACRPRSGEA